MSEPPRQIFDKQNRCSVLFYKIPDMPPVTALHTYLHRQGSVRPKPRNNLEFFKVRQTSSFFYQKVSWQEPCS